MNDKSIARVCILDAPYNIDRQYDYFIPTDLRGTIVAGSFVIVPFGNSNRKTIAVVFELLEESEYLRPKPIVSQINGCVSLSKEMLGLCLFIKEHTFCTVGDAVRSMLPGSAFAKLSKIYSLNTQYKDAFCAEKQSDKSVILYNFIKLRGRVTEQKIKEELGESFLSLLPKLLSEGYIRQYEEPNGSDNERFLDYLSLGISPEEATALAITPSMARSPKQLAIINALLKYKTISITKLKKEFLVQNPQIKALVEKNIAVVEKVDKYNNPYEEDCGKRDTEEKAVNQLNESQMNAYSALKSLYETHEPKAALLYGITGSGKTRVIISLIDRVLADGKAAIMLIPEISLTPQTMRLFRNYYGNKLAVWHSSLSAGEKFDTWQRMKNGEIRLCIGTRSAIFAPMENLGLIVIDEEQEHTYKSDMNPKYHAKDIARYRCAYHNAMMLLASATPSLESFYKAKTGVYSLVELKERYGNAKLPKTVIADLRADSQLGAVGSIGSVLRDNLATNIKNNEQSILFINRRGYNNFLNCPVCGQVLMCPHCSVSLTFHAQKGSGGKEGYLVCHYCGYKQSVPQKCSNCGNEHLRYIGFGTQKVEDELDNVLQGCKTVRMDADTTTKKDSYDSIIESFRNGEGNILLGTQMVTKGHDFPNVTLVGVLLADMSLYVDDFHANERSFALITQVIGRAGRGEKPGRAIIQTYNPEHPVLKYAAAQDYLSFYENEIALRRSFVYPPFCDMFLISLISSVETELLTCTLQFKERIEELRSTEFQDVKLVLFGPFEAPIYKLNEKYRMRFVAKGKSNNRTRALLKRLLLDFSSKSYKNINISIDVNPNSL